MNDITELRILIADDEDMVRKLYTHIFELYNDDEWAELETFEGSLSDGDSDSDGQDKHAYTCEATLCSQGNEAYEAVKAAIDENRPYAIAFLDVRMPPGPDGVTVGKAIRDLDPSLYIAMVTGYADNSSQEIEEWMSERCSYIQKPFHAHHVTDLVDKVAMRRVVEKTS